MSLVGTRPPTLDEWDKYELHHRARLAIKPGITGMWQVRGEAILRISRKLWNWIWSILRIGTLDWILRFWLRRWLRFWGMKGRCEWKTGSGESYEILDNKTKVILGTKDKGQKPFTAILCFASDSDMNEYVKENPDCYENILSNANSARTVRLFWN